jgi:hypothetical protein
VSELQQQNLAASVLPASSHVNAGAPGTVHRALRDAFTAPDAVGQDRDAGEQPWA